MSESLEKHLVQAMDGHQTQTEAVLDYLVQHGSITPMQALLRLGVYRLGARIWDLRHGIRRLNIKTEIHVKRGWFGRVKRITTYRLEA